MNEVAIRSTIPSEHEMQVFTIMAKNAIESKMYASNFKDPSGIMMVMLSARELGISPCQALNGGLNLINGKVEISARMMGALIRRSGHRFKTMENTQTGCTIVGIRGDTGETQTASFTVAEAQQAGIYKAGGGWTKWPKDMCYARALSRLSRQLFQDVIGIGYVEGEIQASECQVILPEEEPVVEQLNNSKEDFYKLMASFSEEDQEPFAKYMQVVSSHMKWTREETEMQFLKDPSATKEKFIKWKEKNV